jgi:hypothetical protein
MSAQIATHAPNSPATAVLAVSVVLSLASAAVASPATENVPVPGGLAALARALDIVPPDPARCLSEIIRLVHADNAYARAREDSPYRRMLAHFAAVSNAASLPSQTEIVPVPLNASVWSHAVFGKAVSPQMLFTAILSDPNAALIAYGLSALDDDTLAFFQNHPALITTLYQRHATVFASFPSHLHIRNGRVVTPGPAPAAGLWESVLSQRVTDPVAFVAALYGSSKGRIAYLYDAIGHLDEDRTAFALGSWLSDGAARVDRFRALSRAATAIVSEWEPDRVPFSRPAFDLLALLQRVRVDHSGAPQFPASQGLWTAALSGKPGDLTARPDGARLADAAWLAETTLAGHGEARSTRLDQLAFGQRVFSSAQDAPFSELVAAIHGLRRAPMLMLAAERIGVTEPRIYAGLVAHAERIAALDASAEEIALAQFQGAMVLIERLVRVRSIDRARAVRCVETLAAVPLDGERGYLGGLTVWLAQQMGSVIPAADGSFEDALILALAGPSSQTTRVVSWEGQTYAFDVAAAERARLRRFREQRTATSIDVAIAVQRLASGAHRGDAPDDARARMRAALEVLPHAQELAVQLDRTQPADRSGAWPQAVDVIAADALVSFAYAIHWPDPAGSPRLEREMPRRHDFGMTSPSRLIRSRRAWSVPRAAFAPGEPVRVEGSLLGLELALASLSLRRTAAAPAAREPRLLSTNRHAFLSSLGLLDTFALRDSDAALIAGAIARGQQRVEALTPGSADVEAVISEASLDGWRARALRWDLTHARNETTGLFSLTELLYLGDGRNLDVHAWGMSALADDACLCTHVPRPGLHTAIIGRHQLGLLPFTVPDLNLRVAVVLHELQLPAPLARKVLDAALYDLLTDVSPMHFDDWLTIVRRARAVPRERIEDYLAGVTAAAGPLVQQAERRGR